LSSVVTPQSAVVVEDDPSTAAALERAISSLGYSVRIASTYNEACALLRSSTPDVALLDITLPDGDGLELIAQTNTQFIVITGDSSHDTAARCVRLKAADILLKPVCLADLRHALAHIVSSVATNDSDTTTDLYIVQCSNGDSREADRASTIEFSQCLERVFSQADPTRQVTLILDDIHALSPTRQKQLLERLTALEHQSCQSDQAKRRRLFQLLSTPNIIAIERSSPGADNNRITTALRTHLEQTRLIVPPLRNRREDIATIAEALLAALNTAHEEERKFDSNAYETMASHQWSGNMRQLTNAITQAYYNTSGPVELSPALDERLPITTASFISITTRS